jgi:hypothetical protein
MKILSCIDCKNFGVTCDGLDYDMDVTPEELGCKEMEKAA